MEIMQQKMEEARKEVAAADEAVFEARQTPVQDTSLFADAEVPVEAPKIPLQPHGLDPRTRARMTEAQNRMKAGQQQQQQPQQAQLHGQPSTPTVTQGTEPFKELPVTQEADSCNRCDKQRVRRAGRTRRQTSERARSFRTTVSSGLEWTGGLRNRFILSVNERFALC